MTVMGFETSCDETAVAIVENGRRVLSCKLLSQIEIHAPFGGVVPEIAARSHIESIRYVTDLALESAGLSVSHIDAYAATTGPGLAGALLVGLGFAKGMGFAKKKPLIGVNHIEGHISANFLETDLEPPFVSLVVSGGHTLLIHVTDYNTYTYLGSTRDDAAGEAFDKIARVLGLGYPGGPEIDRLAELGNPAIPFPRPKAPGLDFSFSGLKTAVIQYLHAKQDGTSGTGLDFIKNNSHRHRQFANGAGINDIAASFRQAVVDVLTEKTMMAAEAVKCDKVVLAGGVACCLGLRRALREACSRRGYSLTIPSPTYCTDNASMIAARGYFGLIGGKEDGLGLNAHPGRYRSR